MKLFPLFIIYRSFQHNENKTCYFFPPTFNLKIVEKYAFPLYLFKIDDIRMCKVT